MKIGVLGAGVVARGLGKHFIDAGHEVVLSNSRGPESLAGVIADLRPKATAGTRAEAAAQDIVMLAVPWLRLEEALDGLPDWGQRILVDITNQFTPGNKLQNLNGHISSEIVEVLAPGARVVKALNNLEAEWLIDGPYANCGRRVSFMSGNDRGAKVQVAALLKDIGFAVIDLGSMKVGGLMQQAGGPLVSRNLVMIPR